MSNHTQPKPNPHTTQIIVRLPIELHNKINSKVINTNQTISTCQDSHMLKKTQSNTNASQRDGIVLSTCSYIIMYFMYPGVQKTHFWFITIPSQGNGE